MLFFSLHLGWLPVSGRFDLLYQVRPITGFALIDAWLSDSPYRSEMIGSALRHMILPITALAVAPTTEVVRLMRISTDDVLSQNYIKAAATRACPALPLSVAMCCITRCRLSFPSWGCSSPPC
ncbi:Peptide transport system permease protein sapB [Serratia plymuthica]|uniref:Peptide transport system permease protein sapB n=1 Tax=Serratia plymuthica TaxID=82996 RepID=A0A2X4V7R5_SERPL|nr:Peptide transport system permease protein sapB [Serratia plymuthica]